MEITGIALQTVAAGEDVAFTETPVCGSKCIVHRQGSGIIKLRGITNQCKARFLVSYSGNIQIPTGGTVGKRLHGLILRLFLTLYSYGKRLMAR